MSDDLSGDWAAYLTEENDAPVTVLVDLALSEGAPDAARPFFIAVSTRFTRPRKDRPNVEEMEEMDALGDALTGALGDEADAVHAGSLATLGGRHWLFYAAHGEVQEVVDRVFGTQAVYKPDVQVNEDAEWEVYRETLYPSPMQWQFIQDQRLLMAMEDAGDVGERPRKIEHYAYFEASANAEKFAAWCGANGFVVEEMMEPGDDMPTPGVHFSHVGPATLEEIYEKTCAATEGVTECEGEYDGWESPVIKR